MVLKRKEGTTPEGSTSTSLTMDVRSLPDRFTDYLRVWVGRSINYSAAYEFCEYVIKRTNLVKCCLVSKNADAIRIM